MSKHLLAFFLACVTASALLSSCTLLHPIAQRPVQININSDSDVSDIISAIASLHRQDVDIHTSKQFRPDRTQTYPAMVFFMGMGFAVISGLVLAFYRLYCRWFGISPSL